MYNQGARHVYVSVPKECASVIRNRIVVLSVYTVQLNLGICTVYRRVHLFIVNCLIKNKFDIHVIFYFYI